MVVQQQIQFESEDLADSRLKSHSTSCSFTLAPPPHEACAYTSLGRSNPKHGLPGQHGSDCRRSDVPSDPCHYPSWLHARHESFMDHISHCTCICTEIPTGIYVGAFLQLHRLPDRNLHQYAHEEEETGSLEEEGRRTVLEHV